MPARGARLEERRRARVVPHGAVDRLPVDARMESLMTRSPLAARHSLTMSPWRWATFHSPSSRRYTCVARNV